MFVIAVVVTWRGGRPTSPRTSPSSPGPTPRGWLFLSLFEELSWVVIVAAIIPFVDAFSVAAGPTKDIVHHHAEVYSAVAVAFVAPGGVARGPRSA